MSWADKAPMPTGPVWHYHVPRRCTCTDGLTLDENWSPEYPEETRADPPWPGEGWLICGICDGDGWYWWRHEGGEGDSKLGRVLDQLAGAWIACTDLPREEWPAEMPYVMFKIGGLLEAERPGFVDRWIATLPKPAAPDTREDPT